ncbi:MAG: TetR/AcrR family transcriptional regulator [Syntrophomonadaceae bacterium]|nr:TetR/AcrR family transcriptional regulator [Syntrophomonadaceae bacterium]
MKSTQIRLKEAAFSLFAAHGYESTTMSQIANAVGIKKPTLYSYYESKEELFLSVFNEVAEEYRQHIGQILEEALQMESTKDQLYHVFRGYITYFAQNPELSAFWNRILIFPPASLKEELFIQISNLESGLYERVAEIIQAGMDWGDLRHNVVLDTLFSFYCLREGLLLAVLLNPDLEPRKIEVVWENIWYGIGNYRGVVHEE